MKINCEVSKFVTTGIFVDRNDNIWVGTDFGGINIMAPQRITFNYSLQGYEKGVPNIISTVLEDKEGNILAGIVDGGLAIKRKGADSFSLFKHNPGDPHSLAPVEKSSVLIWLPLHIHSAFRAESRAMSWMSSEVREEFRLL